MNSFKIPLVKVIGLLALAMLLAAGCTETPEEPDPNIEPNTFITSYNIGIAPDSGSYYAATVYWKSSDPDGMALRFVYWLEDAGGATVVSEDTTFNTSVTLALEFPDGTETYAFYVLTQDNQGTLDPTPASIDIAITTVRSIDKFKPETRIVTGPSNGSLTGTGINVVFSGSDVDGFVESFEYKIDTASAWSSVDNDPIAGSATLDILDIPTGARTLEVRAIDNFGQIDPSPLSVSFVAVDTLYPDLYISSGAIEGAFFFLPAGGTATDIQTGWEGDASWYFSTLEYRYRVDGGVWSEWQEEDGALIEGLEAGAHALDVQAIDLGGNTSIYSTSFGVGSLSGDRGILVVNGISFGDYGSEAEDFWNAMDFMVDYNVDFWDFFDGEDLSNTPELEARLIDTGVIPGDTLGHYSSCVMVVNGYNSAGTTDLEIYQSMLPLVSSYLNAGGNILIAGRYGSSFITGDVLEYANIEYGAIGVNIANSGLTAQVTGLVDIAATGGNSLTDLPNIPTHEDVTVLFLAPDYPDNIGGFITEPEGFGKLAHIAGRPYRLDLAAQNTNYDFILSNYFGEE